MKKFYSAKYQGKISKQFAKKVKKVIMKTTESKKVGYSWGKYELYHNGGVAGAGLGRVQINLSSTMPPTGTGEMNRIGDQINLSGWKIRMVLGQKADRPNVNFKYWVLKVPKGSSFSYNDWFKNFTSNVLLDDINEDFVKVLKTGSFKPYRGDLNNGTDEFTFVKKLWIPYKKLLKFGPADGTTLHNDDDIHFIMAVYDAYGTLNSDNIAYMQFFSELYYRDP